MYNEEYIEGFKFISIGETSSDCTSPYRIEFKREFTLGEFIKEVLKVKGWGYFEISGKRVEYKNGEIISQNPFLKSYHKHIVSCTSRGGWGCMDYKIILDNAISEYELMLEDRIAKIQAINEQYDLEHNGYISFSGGRDSTLLHKLIDIALPNNKIPRLFINTGVEYSSIRKFVVELAKTDDRIKIINSGVNLKNMLTKEGYPFKSKQHSHNWSIFNNNKEETLKYFEKINNDNSLLFNLDFIDSLPNGVITNVKYFYGIREKKVLPTQNTEQCGREREREHYLQVPKISLAY